jgi:hypothetical protein
LKPSCVTDGRSGVGRPFVGYKNNSHNTHISESTNIKQKRRKKEIARALGQNNTRCLHHHQLGHHTGNPKTIANLQKRVVVWRGDGVSQHPEPRRHLQASFSEFLMFSLSFFIAPFCFLFSGRNSPASDCASPVLAMVCRMGD